MINELLKNSSVTAILCLAYMQYGHIRIETPCMSGRTRQKIRDKNGTLLTIQTDIQLITIYNI